MKNQNSFVWYKLYYEHVETSDTNNITCILYTFLTYRYWVKIDIFYKLQIIKICLGHSQE